VDDYGRIFVQRRSADRSLFPSTWDVVGGHVEPGETAHEALRREVAEETGWRVTEVLALVGEYAYRGDDGIDRQETDYLVRVAGDLTRPRLEPDTHTEFRWLGPDELDLLDQADATQGLIRQLVTDGFAAVHRTVPVGLAPARFAALVAPAIDRAFIDGMAVAREGGGRDVTRAHGPGAGALLVEFRTALGRPGRTITPQEYGGITRYRDPREFRAQLAEQAALGWIELDEDGGFRASAKGLAFLSDLWAAQGTALDGVWTDPGVVSRLVLATGAVLDAAVATGGPALRATTPIHEPPGARPTAVLLNRLGTLRYHRADAHAAAWTAAGLTAAEVQAMAGGPVRAAVEADTNARAAAPYTRMSLDARLSLLADLAALPGQGRD
jgi:8-oxo-dGTP pyrophosphatase MutT (NUDIX family)